MFRKSPRSKQSRTDHDIVLRVGMAPVYPFFSCLSSFPFGCYFVIRGFAFAFIPLYHSNGQ